MQQDKMYEVEMKFNKDVFSEEQLEKYLKEQFHEDAFKRNGYDVAVLVYIPYDKYTDADDELSIIIGSVLKGGKYGVCVEYAEVEL